MTIKTLGCLAAAGSTMLFSACGSSGSSDAKGATEIAVSLSDAGCEPAKLTVDAGKTEFEVTSTSSGKVTEYEILDGQKVLAERENITPGIKREFVIDLKPGTYTTYCPGGSRPKGTLVVAKGAG